jgi:hypothetical protein
MLPIFHVFGMFVVDLFKSRGRLEAENLLLRHQLNIALRWTSRRPQLGGGGSRAVQPIGDVIAIPVLGGLHHHYVRI